MATDDNVHKPQLVSYVRTIPNDYARFNTLDSSKREIRLISIFRQKVIDDPSRGERLGCVLYTAPLSEAPPYRALSYCWGDLSDTCEVMLFPRNLKCTSEQSPLGEGDLKDVEGMPFKITKNLHRALWEMCSDGGEKLIWVDMICINQGNLTEKGHQVQMMREIFSSAASVLVWLGSGPNDPSASIFKPSDRSLWVFHIMISFRHWENGLHTYFPFQQNWETLFLKFAEDVLLSVERQDELEELVPTKLSRDVGYCWDSTHLEELFLQRVVYLFIAWVYEPYLHDPDRLIEPPADRINWESELRRHISKSSMLESNLFHFVVARIRLLRAYEMIAHHFVVGEDSPFENPTRLAPEGSHEFEARLKMLTSDNWFWRTWTVQEVAYNKNVHVRHLGVEVKWESALALCAMAGALTTARQYCRDCPQEEVPESGNVTVIPGIWHMLKPVGWNSFRPQGNTKLRLLTVLQFGGILRATDPRDTIFAIYSLASDVTPSFVPDYSKSRDDIFRLFTKWVVREQRSLDILHWKLTTSEHLPSWTPDYTQANGTKGWEAPYYHASNKGVRILKGADLDILRLAGFELGTIVETVKPSSVHPEGTKWTDLFFPWIWLHLRHRWRRLRWGQREPREAEGVRASDLSMSLQVDIFNFIYGASPCKESLAFFARLYERHIGEQHMLDRWVPSILDIVTVSSWGYYVKREDIDGVQERMLRKEVKDLMGQEPTFFFTKNGSVGFCLRQVQGGDKVVVLHGGRVPFILRPVPADLTKTRSQQLKVAPRYTLISGCYLEGVMRGEIFESPHWQGSRHRGTGRRNGPGLSSDPSWKHWSHETFQEKVFDVC